MTNKEFKEELKERIKKAELSIRSVPITQKKGILIITTKLNTEYMSIKNYANIRGLYAFIINHPELKTQQIETLLKANANTFKFLDHTLRVVDDMINDLRDHGSYYVELRYNKEMEYNKKVKKIQESKI